MSMSDSSVAVFPGEYNCSFQEAKDRTSLLAKAKSGAHNQEQHLGNNALSVPVPEGKEAGKKHEMKQHEIST